MAAVFSTVTASRTGGSAADLDPRQIAIDGKTLRGSKDAEGRAEHVLSALCVLLEQSLGHASSRGKGLEIPDALRVLDRLDLTGKVVTGDAIYCQKTITSKITDKGGDYLLPVKRNQKDLLEEIVKAFLDSAFPPELWHAPRDAGHGRIDQRSIALLPDRHSPTPCAPLGHHCDITCVTRKRDHVRSGRIKTEVETTYLITSFDVPRPETLLRLNRAHWQIEIMYRDKDVCLGEDGYTNRKDHAPRNIFTLLSAARTGLKRVNTSPTKAIEIVQNDRNRALKILTHNSK